MALTQESFKLLLDQQRLFMEETREARKQEMEQHKDDRKVDILELKSLIIEVKNEVEKQVEVLEVKQKKAHEEVLAVVTEVSEKQASSDTDRAQLDLRVSELEKELKEVKAAKNVNPTFATVTRNGAAAPYESPVAKANSDKPKIRDIIKDAKKVMGLCPINSDDIRRQGNEHETDDEEEKLLLSVKEYLRYELKMNKDNLEELTIVNIWKENVKNFECVYVEFSDEDSVDFCFRHAVNMRKEARLKRFIPPQFKARAKELYNQEYKYRRPPPGETAHKTRVKFGNSDLVLMIKTQEERYWTYIDIETLDLPSIDLSSTTHSEFPTVRKSPAEGRKRDSKRLRSPGDSSPSDQAKKTQKTVAQTPPTSVLLAKPRSVVDIGSFAVTNARSPQLKLKSKLVDEFHFSPSKQSKCQE